MRVRCTAVLAALCAPAVALPAQSLPTPASHLGFEVGADRRLADWPQIVGYFGRLAAASPSVKLDTLGTTTLGRPFVLVTISSPENLRNLDAIRRVQARLADPRGLSDAEEARLVAAQPAIVVIQCGIHSTEVGASQMAMELAWRLATNDTLQAALRNVVVLLIPSANPDGNQMIAEWYRSQLGTRWEGGPMPWLYHHYVGHDNNRDWYMVTQRETRLITDLLYRQWFPIVFYDVHQMGNGGMRMFVPPFVDPINPNLDPIVVRAIDHIGAEMSLALESRGKQGVGHGAIYDLWWHGGARSTPTRHNIVGVLTEAASVRIATPIEQDSSDLRGHARGLPVYERRMNFPNPWPGGTWRLRDIVDYELITSEALVTMLSQQRAQYVRNFVGMGRRSVRLGESQPPHAFLIPREQHDPGAARRLLEVLRVGGVELEATPEAYLVSLAQPYRAHAKDLLEPQGFPKLEQWPGGPPERPYDVAGWTLSQQMGVRVVQMDTQPTVRGTPVTSLSPPLRTCTSERTTRAGYVAFDPRNTDSYAIVFGTIRSGAGVRITTDAIRTPGGASLPAGTFVVERRTAPGAATAPEYCGMPILPALPAGRSIARLPRVALYKPWTASMDEGWTRFVLEQFSIPFVSLTDSMARSGAARLRDQFDVILVPDMSLREMRSGMSAAQVPPPYAGGLGTEGVRALAEFTRTGGTLVLLDGSTEFATSELGVPVRLITQGNASGSASQAGAQAGAEPLYAPGSVLRVLIDTSHPVARGMPDSAAVYFTNSVSFDVAAGAPVRVIARYPERGDDILLSGYLQGAQAIAGRAAAVEASAGSGRVVMFGFRPQYRGQSYGTFKMLFNALLEGSPSLRQ